MKIKKIGNTALEIKFDKNTLEVHYDVQNRSFSLNFENGAYKSIAMPGEYEFSGVTVFAYEQKKERYEGKINYLSVGDSEGVHIFLSSEDFEFNKDDVSELSAINVIVNFLPKKDVLSALLKRFTPEYCVFVKGDQGDDFQKLVASFQNVREEAGNFTLSSADFNTGEDIATQFVLVS